MCHCSPYTPKGVARLFARIGFGLSLAFVGFAHYQDPEYAEAVGRGLNFLEPLGMVWGYVLPGLMIIGGLLLAFGIYMEIAAYTSSIAIASIPMGLMLKSAIGGIALDDMMPAAMNAFIWLIVLLLVVKGEGSCGGACGCGPGSAVCACGKDGCNCDMPGKMTSMKSTPIVPRVTKAPAKKVPVRKVGKR